MEKKSNMFLQYLVSLIFAFVIRIPNSSPTIQDSFLIRTTDSEFSSIDATPGFLFKPNTSGDGIIYIIGDVSQVLEGKIPPGTQEITWSANGIIGFGAGIIGPIAGTGEAFYANGLAYVRSTDNESEQYFQTIQDSEFRSPFSLLVYEDAIEDGTATYASGDEDPTSPAYTLLNFHQDVYTAVDTMPHCFHGMVKFKQMEGIAISKAPIYGEPIDGNYTDGGYYAKPPFTIPDAEAMIFSCSANYSTIEDPILIEKLKRGLYVNPNDPGASRELLIHSHGLTVKLSIVKGNQESLVRETHVPDEVYHFLSNSTIKEIRTKVFKMESADKLQDWIQSNGAYYCTSISLVPLLVWHFFSFCFILF